MVGLDYENPDVMLTVCIPALCIFTDVETNVCPAVVDVQRGKEGWAEENSENSGRENLLDQDGIMDFSVVAIAEELTQIDSVRNEILYVPDLCIFIVTVTQMIRD